METHGYVLTVWLYIWHNIIKSSLTYRILTRIYGFFSQQWQTSMLTNLFRKTYVTEDTVKNSLWGKLCFSPFLIIEGIQHKKREQLTVLKERSRIVRIFNYLLHNILAVNLRFLGVLITSASATLLLSALYNNVEILIPVICSAIGGVLCIFDINVTEYLSGTVTKQLCEKAMDTTISLKFFYLTKCGGRDRLLWAAIFGILAGITGTYFGADSLFIVIGGTTFLSLILYKPEFGVAATLFLAPVLSTMSIAVISLLCLLSLIIKALTVKRFTFRTEGIGLMIIILLMVYLLSTFTSFTVISSLKVWAIYFAFMSFYFVIINTIKTKKQLFDLLKVFVLSGVAVSVYGILQYISFRNTGFGWMTPEAISNVKTQITSTFETPDDFGEYLLLCLPIGIALMKTAKNAFSRILFAVFSVIMLTALILTFSGGCWVSFAVTMTFFITFVAGKLWIIIIPLLALVPTVVPQHITSRFTDTFRTVDISSTYRVSIWMGTLLMLRDFWVSGIGLGTDAFVRVYPLYSYEGVVAPHPHNLFLHVITESGAIGIFIFIFLLFIFFKRLIAGHHYFGKGNDLSTIIVTVGAMLIGFLFQGLLDNCFSNYKIFMLFWAIIAIGIVACNIAKTEAVKIHTSENGNRVTGGNLI